MTDLETEVKVERKLDRQETPNLFSARTFSNSVSQDLKKFETYKPTDLNELFKQLEKKSEQSKPQEIDSTDLDNFTKLETDEFPVMMSKTVEVSEPAVSLKINLKGKLIIFVASVALVLFTFLAIFNAVTIHNLNASIDSLNNEITITEQVLNEKRNTYNALTDETRLEGEAQNLGFDEVQSEKVHTLKISNVNSNSSTEKSGSNWFDGLCEWVAQLFGA